MSEQSIGCSPPALQQIHETLKTTAFNSVRQALPDKAILQACRDVGLTWRERLLSPVVIVLHMVVAGLWPEDSLAASFQLLWAHLHSLLPTMDRKAPSSGSVAKARARLPLELWRRLFQWLSRDLQARAQSLARWRGLRVVLLDGSTVSMPDTPRLHRAFGTCSGTRRGKFPLARVVVAVLAHTMTIVDYRMGRYRDSEIALTWPLLQSLSPGDLVVADRQFAAAHYYLRYRRHGLHFITRMNGSCKLKRLRDRRMLSDGTLVGRMRVNRRCRHAQAWMPGWVEVRLLQASVRVRGRRTLLHVVTSLLDEVAYPAAEVLALYRRRWSVETTIRQAKTGMSADVLRSRDEQGVRKELAARLMALNIVRSIMLEAALSEGLDPCRISFVQAVRTLVAFAPRMATAPVWQLPAIYRAMLRQIAWHTVPWRPDRLEPRMIKREKKHYPSLKTTRDQWRQNHAA